jgi:hypothetical protein
LLHRNWEPSILIDVERAEVSYDIRF